MIQHRVFSATTDGSYYFLIFQCRVWDVFTLKISVASGGLT